MKRLITAKWLLALLLCASFAQAQSLKGSPASIQKQYGTAQSYGLAFVNNARSVRNYIGPGQLVRVTPTRTMDLHDVSFPYAQPGASLFVSRLSQQYYSTCGEKLVVTSLLRPRDRQPANSVAHSVHPTGMAVDLRIPKTGRCRAWLEDTLLSLERSNIVEATRERFPPHYHVAVFTRRYESYVAGLGGEVPKSAPKAINVAPQRVAYTNAGRQYTVRRGDSLSEISSRTGVSVAQLRAVNGLRGNLIRAGQKLEIPGQSVALNLSDLSDGAITHRVNRGDTLWHIANRYGTSVKELRNANSQYGDALQVGQVLIISKG